MEPNPTKWLWGGIVIAVLVLGVAGYVAFATDTNAVETPEVNSQELTEGEGAVPTSSKGSESAAQTSQGRLPIAKTVGFSSVSSTTAVVAGTVVPRGAPTTYWFEYGSSPNFGQTVDARSAGAGLLELGAAGYLTGLKPATEYYFRIAAQNAYGRVYGGVYKFITESN